MECNCEIGAAGPPLAGTCGGGAFLVFMGLLEQFLKTQCDIEDPCGHPRPRATPDQEYDFIVVGGGTAGAVVASRLSEVPDWKVLLIEAGSNEPTGSQVPSMFLNFFGSSIDWKFKTEPEPMACLGNPEQRCKWPRGKVLGGTSVLHGMMYMRGSPQDFDWWEKAGNKGWGFQDVLRYFKKSENNLQLDEMDKSYHSKGGPMPISQFPYRPPLADAVMEAAQSLGFRTGVDLNGANRTGFAIAQTTNKNGIRYSAARAFLRPAAKRPNLHVMLNTLTARVLVNKEKKQAYGVEILKENGTRQRILASKEVVVCGGAVNSPQILLLSGIGPSKHLSQVNVPLVHHLPGVGRNLHNHVAYRVSFYINDTDTTALNWASAVQYLLQRDGLMSSTGMSQTTGFINTKYADADEGNPDIQVFFGGYLANCAKTGEVGEISGKVQNGVVPKRVITITPTVLRPVSRGYLQLKDNNPASHPKIFGNYLTKRRDLDVEIEGIKFVVKLSKSDALQKYGFQLNTNPVPGCESMEFGSDSYWECAVRRNTVPENHQAGSCKMGPSTDAEAVVDAELKVHGLQGLRVMDASIMPNVTSGNTAAPVIMIAEKGCDMIKKKWGKL